jgi:hypothetical protein
VESFLQRFVAYPSEHAVVAHALWIAHCHMIARFDTTPRLAFMSAEKASGKTRALEVTSLFVPNPRLAFSTTSAALVRIIAQGHEVGGTIPTILYDEIDNLFAKKDDGVADLRAALNAGYRVGSVATRCANHGAIVVDYPCFAPVALAGLKELPDTLASRSIFIRMRRRAPGEEVEPFRNRIHSQQAKPIMEALAEWCAERNVGPIDVDMPAGIEDRNAECWEPLFVIADEAGGDWPERARDAALYLTKNATDESLTPGVELLAHIREAFRGDEHLATVVLLARLCDRDESPWKDIRGRPLDDRGLARRLKPYGIRSKTVRIGGSTPKGYSAADFTDAWSRYLPPGSDVRHKGNKRHNFDNQNNFVADVADVAAIPAKGEQSDNDPFAAFKDPSLALQPKG